MFLHFVHDQTLKLYQVRELIGSEDQLVRCMRGALKIITYISTDPLIIPTSDIVQSPVVAALIDDFTLLADHELLTFVGSTVDIDQLMAYEQAHFSNTSLYTEWESALRSGVCVGSSSACGHAKSTRPPT